MSLKSLWYGLVCSAVIVGLMYGFLTFPVESVLTLVFLAVSLLVLSVLPTSTRR